MHPTASTIDASPFTRKLGAHVTEAADGRAVVTLPFDAGNTTVADMVHGGAILTLADVAATAAAWSTVEDPTSQRGITVDLNLQFMAAGRSEGLTAEARVVRRGASLCFLDVLVRGEGDKLVAHAMVTYKLSKAG